MKIFKLNRTVMSLFVVLMFIMYQALAVHEMIFKLELDYEKNKQTPKGAQVMQIVKTEDNYYLKPSGKFSDVTELKARIVLGKNKSVITSFLGKLENAVLDKNGDIITAVGRNNRFRPLDNAGGFTDADDTDLGIKPVSDEKMIDPWAIERVPLAEIKRILDIKDDEKGEGTEKIIKHYENTHRILRGWVHYQKDETNPSVVYINGVFSFTAKECNDSCSIS
ncbi:MAG: hypothetical protein K0R14_1775 [Burkholderiales bacterium]|jgi:hypothetical protein|nr:hypothetical protein [Burkholderiales bacterium]